MKPSPISVAMLLVSLFFAPALLALSPNSANQSAASPAQSPSAAEVPRLIKFSGTLLDAQDRPLVGPVGVTFALYSQQTGGAALWMETQNVTPDAHGFYTVLLGANSTNGMPAELFASGEARWLGIQVGQQLEQARILLVSVPYALKAVDAQTLGGKPASAYALAGAGVSLVTGTAGTSGAPVAATGGAALAAGTSGPQPLNTGTTPVTTAGGTVGNLTKFDGNADITNAGISENGSFQVAIGGAPSTNAKLFLTDTQTDFGAKWLQQGLFITKATKSGSNTALTFDMDMTNMSISPGVTDSGARLAFRSLAYANTLGFAGTLNQQIGILAQAGIRSATSGAVVNSAYGGQFSILNLVPGTTINNAYGVWISNTGTGGTITNRYDLYASSPNANNFFAGKVGIGTTTPVANLEVNGTTKFDGLVSFAGGQTFPGTGTITAVNTAAGSGLMGGATSGAANLSLINTCAVGQVLQWNAAAWVCASAGGAGTVTSVGSGLGLAGGPITGSGTLAINPAVVPQLTASSNTFTGSMTASSFNGSGAGLTNVNAAALNGLASTAFATVGANSFTGNQSITGNVSLTGNLGLPNTTSGTVGVITLGGTPFAHNFSTIANGGNTFIGLSAGNFSMTGTSNTAVGASALKANTTGIENAAFGSGALSSNTAGGGNAAFGEGALFSNTSGNSNGAFGFEALLANTSGFNNNAFGVNALHSNTTGFINDAFGSGALSSNTTGSRNAAFGDGALTSDTTGSGNAAFGRNALDVLTGGNNNIAIGDSAGSSLTALESNNIYIGNTGTAGESNTIRIGSSQTSTFLAGTVRATSFLGDGSGLTGIAALGASNTFSGLESFTAAPSGGGVGQGSLYINPAAASAGQTLLGAAVNNVQQMRLDSGGNLTLAGTLGLPNTTSPSVGVVTLGGTSFLHNFGTNNTFLGASAGNTSASLTGSFNTGVGANALNAITTGGSNAAFGASALTADTTGFSNNAFGSFALAANTTGSDNAAFGEGALQNNTTACCNDAFGHDALIHNTTGFSNNAFGLAALVQNTTGNFNAAFGDTALGVNTTGTSNAAFGHNALASLTGGNNDIAIGDSAGNSLTGLESNDIYIGNTGTAGESNIIRIGSSQTATFLAGTVTATKFLGDGSGLMGIAALGASNTFSGLESFTAAPSGGGVGQGSLYVNPASASAGQTLLGAAVNNVQQMRLDSGGNLTLAGTLGLPNTNGAGTAGVVFLGGARFLHNFGTNNIFLGAGSGNTGMTGGANTAVGGSALAANTTGNDNAAFGPFALSHNTTGSVNSAFGLSVLFSNTTGSDNNAFGVDALGANTTGIDNNAFGVNALGSNTTASGNAAFGTNALAANTTASGNSAFGTSALQSNTTGSGNAAFGTSALQFNTSGGLNAAFGGSALFHNTTGGSNSAFGHDALFSNTTGGDNAAFGLAALLANTTGNSNSAFGENALQQNTAGNNNNAFGLSALILNSTGNNNNAFGLIALENNTTGGDNAAFGTSALRSNATGAQNSAFGNAALNSNTNGASNVAFGFDALISNTTGFNNTAVGTGAGLTASSANANTTGFDNTFLGFQAGPGTSTQLSNATAIGANALVSASNAMVLGDGTINVGIGTSTPAHRFEIIDPGSTGLRVQTNTIGGVEASFGGNGAFQIDAPGIVGGRFVVTQGGNVGIGTSTPANTLEVKAGGTTLADAWTTRSSARFKTNVQPLLGALAKVQQLRGVSYDLRATGKHQIGLIAEEVARVLPEVVSFESNGTDAQGLDYARLTALLIEAVKQQQVQISEQQMLMSRQQDQLQMQRAEIAQLASQ